MEARFTILLANWQIYDSSPDGIASPDGIKGKVSHVSVRVFLRPSSMIQEMDPPTFDCWQLQVKGVFQFQFPLKRHKSKTSGSL
jgi:hypothetical protein